MHELGDGVFEVSSACGVDDVALAYPLLLGARLSGREEAVETLTTSADPRLRSCAAYAIGELQLPRFAPMLERWASAPDPLLRASAEGTAPQLWQAASKMAGGGLL